MTQPIILEDFLDDLVGTTEIADALGYSHNTVYSWIQRGQFPDPIKRISGTPVWLWSNVRRWAIDTGRLTAEAPTS